MNLLSSIWSGIKGVGSAIGSGLNSVGSYLGEQTAAAINSFTGPGAPGQQTGPNMSYAPPQPADPWAYAPKPNQSLVPNMSTPNGPGAIDPKTGQLVIYGQGGQVNPLASIMANSGVLTTEGTYRPSTYTPPPAAAPKSNPTGGIQDPFGRESTREAGVPYFNEKGMLIVPKTGFSGMTGNGGAGFQSMATQGAQGEQGGGTSAHTGLLGAAGTATGQGSTALSDEEKRKQESKTGSTSLSPATQKAVEGITAPFQQKNFSAPSVPDTIDAGYLQKVQESINSIASSGSSLSSNDRQMYINQIASNLMAAKTKLDQQAQLPEQPVIDTQEQMQWLQDSGDEFGAKQLMDEWRAQNTNLSELHTTRVDLMKNVQALNEAYRPILKDIKENPDLPKALARRRIEDLSKTQKETMQGFLDQLEIVNQQVSDQNETVNRAFNIMTFAVNQQDKAKDNARQNLSLMISSGAIAGFTNAEIKSYAQALGVSTQTLQKAKEMAITPKVDPSVKTDKNGDLVGIDQKTGKEIWRISGFEKPASTAGSNPTQWETQNNEIASINQLMNMRASDGTPYADANGYFTVEGFKRILQNTSLPRSTVIEQFAGNISPWNAKNYGLTPAEIKKLGFE